MTGRARAAYPRKAKKADTEPGKRSPTSLNATLKGIRHLGDHVNAAEFAPALQLAFDYVCGKYPAILSQKPNSPPASLEKRIKRWESGGVDLKYPVLRTYAEHLNIPTGLLLLYSHVIGDIAKGASAASISDWLTQASAALASLNELVLSDNEADATFISRHPKSSPAEGRYNIKTEPLKRFVAAYHEMKNEDA